MNVNKQVYIHYDMSKLKHVTILYFVKFIGKAQVSAEHLKHSCRNIWILLARLFSSMLVHGHMPCDMIQAVVIPIIKNKTKSTSEKGNYRPVTLANVISKVFDKVLLSRLLPFLNTLPNQFGFKPKHGTEQSVFILKECLQYYVQHGSVVFTCYLDASMAFDKISHVLLFQKLLEIGVPMYLIRVSVMVLV